MGFGERGRVEERETRVLNWEEALGEFEIGIGEGG